MTQAERTYQQAVQTCDGAWSWMMEGPKDKGRVFNYRARQSEKHIAWQDVLAERRELAA